MTGARDWPSRGTATDTLSDRRPESDRDDVSVLSIPSVPEPRHGDDWPGVAPPAGWFLADNTGVRMEPDPDIEAEGPPDPIVFGPPASPWQRSDRKSVV